MEDRRLTRAQLKHLCSEASPSHASRDAPPTLATPFEEEDVDDSLPLILKRNCRGRQGAPHVSPLSQPLIVSTMVEELAHIIKDNLFCKHLVLSTEESMIYCLQNISSHNGILELKPMSPYHRLLLHRLAEIFGFSHESVGEGDERHLVLERCADSSIPPILVSDFLWNDDNSQSGTTTHILMRKSSQDMKDRLEPFTTAMTIEKREASYLAARERIFSLYEEGKEHTQLKPRNIPVVARRMIAHALGKRISARMEGGQHKSSDIVTEKVPVQESQNKGKGNQSLASKTLEETKAHKHVQNISCAPHEEKKENALHLSACSKKLQEIKSHKHVQNISFTTHKEKEENALASSGFLPSTKAVSRGNDLKFGGSFSNFENEHAGAAKRMFAQALGLPIGPRIGRVSKT